MNFLNIPFPAPGVTTKKRGFAPAVTGTTFSIAENEDATVLGTISATDANVGDTITYSITAGNGAGKFAINATTGSLSTTGGLDYETTPQYVLTIRATDDGGLYGSGTVTVSATDVNEAPVVNDGQYFSISESAVSGTTLSPIAASDVDGDTLTYSITGGNTGTAFSINASTGVLSTEFQLDHETVASYTLTILVSDGALWDTTTVAITVSDVNEPPIAVDATFTEDENGGVSILGTIAASDVDDGATLTYSITAGNGDSLFTINAADGALSTTGDLDYETEDEHVLTITVTDDGTGELSDTATVTVTVTDVAEGGGGGSVPTNEFVLSGVTGSNPQSCLTMSSSDFGAWDRTNFGVLVRVFPDFDGAFQRTLWAQYEYPDAADRSFYCYLGTNKLFYFYVRGTAGHKYIYAYDDTHTVPSEQEYLAYFTYTEDGSTGDYYMRIFVSSDDNTPTEKASVLNNNHPIYTSTSDMIFGAYKTNLYGMKGTIHQPIFFSGGTIPTHEEIGTADTPVALNGHASAWSVPNADDLPNDEILSTAWTNNNSVGVQTH